MKTTLLVFIIATVLGFCGGIFAQTANQYEIRKWTTDGMVSYWITGENSKAFGLNSSGVPAMLTVSGGGGVTDPELLALAGLTSAANRVPYFTGSGTADLLDLSSGGTELPVWSSAPMSGGYAVIGSAGAIYQSGAGIDVEGSNIINLPAANLTGTINAARLADGSIPVAKLEALTASRLLVSNGSGVISPSAVTSTEAGYLSGVTSAIQTQINTKAASSAALMTVAFVGDSIMAWTGNGNAVEEELLADTKGEVTGTNFAVTSYGMNLIAGTMTDDALATNPKVLIVEGGVNDILAGDSFATWESKYDLILSKCVAANCKMLVEEIWPCRGFVLMDNTKQAALEAWNVSLRAWVLANDGVELIEIYDAMEDPSNPGYLNPAYSADGIHPNVTPNLGVEAHADILHAALLDMQPRHPRLTALSLLPNGAGFLYNNGSGTLTYPSLGTGVLSALGVNVGSAGAFVVNGGALGTPSSGTLTNATGLPISTGVSGLGTGVATTLGTNLSITGGGTIALGGFTLTVPATGTAALLGTANVFTAAQTVTVAGAVSTSGLKIDGTWSTAGTTTTDKPSLLVEPAGATSTNWSTSGTGLGVNAASGSTGNLIDLQTNGTNYFKVSASDGTTTCLDGLYVMGASIVTGFQIWTSYPLAWSSGLKVFSEGAAILQVGADITTIDATDHTIKGGDTTGGTDKAGSDVTVASGRGTGTAVSALIFSTPTAVASGTTAQTNTERMRIAAANVTFTAPPKLPAYTVATLPSTAATGMVTGAMAYVTDATAPTYLGALTGGGAVVCPVFYNGSAWVSH